MRKHPRSQLTNLKKSNALFFQLNSKIFPLVIIRFNPNPLILKIVLVVANLHVIKVLNKILILHIKNPIINILALLLNLLQQLAAQTISIFLIIIGPLPEPLPRSSILGLPPGVPQLHELHDLSLVQKLKPGEQRIRVVRDEADSFLHLFLGHAIRRRVQGPAGHDVVQLLAELYPVSEHVQIHLIQEKGPGGGPR